MCCDIENFDTHFIVCHELSSADCLRAWVFVVAQAEWLQKSAYVQGTIVGMSYSFVTEGGRKGVACRLEISVKSAAAFDALGSLGKGQQLERDAGESSRLC